MFSRNPQPPQLLDRFEDDAVLIDDDEDWFDEQDEEPADDGQDPTRMRLFWNR